MTRSTMGLILLLAASSLVLAGIAGMSLFGPQTFTASDNGKNVTVSTGAIFWVSLPENPAAGYAWDLKLSDGLSKLSDKYEPADRSGMKTGVGGTHSYEIKATGNGTQMITGRYTRPGNESQEAIESYSLIVNVNDGGPLSGLFRVPAMIAAPDLQTQGHDLLTKGLAMPAALFPAFPVIRADTSVPPLPADTDYDVARDIRLSYTDVPPDDTVSAGTGDLIRLTLPENPSTGYSWQMTWSDGLEKVSDNYLQGNTGVEGRRLVGAPGTHEWIFEVTQPGTQKVTGVYKRPWETSGADEKTYTLTVNAA